MKAYFFSGNSRQGLYKIFLALVTLCLADSVLALSGMEKAMLAPDDYYHRTDNQLGSWMALTITLSSILIAFALNYAAPKVRTIGTVLASLGCFTVAGWFVFFVLNSGVFSNRRPPSYAVDNFDPLVLSAQAFVGLVAGIFLLRVAFWQSRRNDTLALPAVNSSDNFGLVSRYLHWITAILFISLFPIGVFSTMIPFDAPYRQGYYVGHKSIGFTVLALLIVRLFWHRMTQTPKLDGGLTKWEYKSAKIVHFLLYFLMIAFPVTGFIGATAVGKFSNFYIWDLPLIFDRHLQAAVVFGLLHKVVLPYTFYVVGGAHILGALKHHFIDKHYKSIHRMVS